MSSSSSSSSCSRATFSIDEPNKMLSIDHDVILTQIFSRLDGPTLASVGCVSSELHTLATHQHLWLNIIHSNWPSTTHPLLHQLISTFPNGSFSFFSNSFPLLLPNPTTSTTTNYPSLTPELISAVDIHYKNIPIYSKVRLTETLADYWFQYSPFRIDLLDPKEVVHTSLSFTNDTCRDLMENLKLSWILIDPIGRRAANISSVIPVSVQKHWLTENIELKFVTILAGDRSGSPDDFNECGIVVTCGRSGEGEVHVREVSLKIEDMDGINLNGEDGLLLLQRGITNGKRKKLGRKEEVRERYEEYLEMKRDRRERKLRRERRFDRICSVFGVWICFALSVIGVFLVIFLFSVNCVNYCYSYMKRRQEAQGVGSHTNNEERERLR